MRISPNTYFLGLYPKKDYERADFLNSVKQESETDIFERSVPDASDYYRIAGKIYEDAGAYDTAHKFYLKNYQKFLFSQNPDNLELAQADIYRIKDKMKTEKDYED